MMNKNIIYNHLFNNDKPNNPPKSTVYSFNKIWARSLEVQKTHALKETHWQLQ